MHTLKPLALLLLLAGPASAQVVVVAPSQSPRDPNALQDPYGQCLPNLNPATQGQCIPNPYYRADHEIAIVNPLAAYRQAPGADSGVASAIAKLEFEMEALRQAQMAQDATAAASVTHQEAQRLALANAIKAQQQLAASYRVAWPAWSQHWHIISPALDKALAQLESSASAGNASQGCGYAMGFLAEQKIQLPPAPDSRLEQLHGALYALHELCGAKTKDAAAIRDAAEAGREAVMATGEWEQGRSAYYAAAAP